MLKMNSSCANCCLGKEPFRGNRRCTDLSEQPLIIFQLVLVCVCVFSVFNAVPFCFRFFVWIVWQAYFSAFELLLKGLWDVMFVDESLLAPLGNLLKTSYLVYSI